MRARNQEKKASIEYYGNYCKKRNVAYIFKNYGLRNKCNKTNAY